MEPQMQEVVPGLWLGDYPASQNTDLLDKHGITAIVSVMRQEYTTTRRILRIGVDDTAATNIIAHFPTSNAFIREALITGDGESVLVHCQAGVSRSTTLVAAFLMSEFGLDVEQAVDKVKSIRRQVEPNEFFLHQLEMYERCDCEWDPVKWNEQRRFLMNFAQAQIMDGTSPSIVLAYYPSPVPSPGPSSRRFSESGSLLKMTPLDPASVSAALEQRRRRSSSAASNSSADDPVPVAAATPMRKRLTARGKTPSSTPEVAQSPSKKTVEKIGTKGQVVVVGKRIRCKLCRRELAAREHILVHEPGMGQQAFAPHRRDMAAHRAEQERRRLDELDREKLANRDVAKPSTAASADAVTPGIAGLRIAAPRGAGIPGLRIAQPRPRALDPAPPASPETADRSPAPSLDEPLVAPVPSSEPIEAFTLPDPNVANPLSEPSPEPPLLPSHLCSSYFVEPLSWMSPTLESGVLAGKLVCPNKKCGAKLGSYDWAGLQCSCGAWVCPGFALNVSRVDEFKPAKDAVP